MYPKNAGPIKRPAYPIVVMAAIPSVEGIPDIRPPSLKNIGTILAAPIPTNTNPNKTSGNQEVQITMPIPAARSEERRVGKESSRPWQPPNRKQKYSEAR